MRPGYLDIALHVRAVIDLGWDGFYLIEDRLARVDAELVGYCHHTVDPPWLLTTRFGVRWCPDPPESSDHGSESLSGGARGMPDASALASDCGQGS